MAIINTILGIPLGYIIYLAYNLTGNFAVSVIIFAFIVRALLLPVNITAHKNSIRLLQIEPQLSRIKRQYAGDKERLSEAQYELFKKEKYSPLMSLIPLFVQLLLLLGILQVMYHPMQHILHMTAEEIAVHTQNVLDSSSTAVPAGAGRQMQVLSTLGLIDLNFLGINLGVVPSLLNPSIELLVPALSGISALIYCLVQNSLSPGALSQSSRTNAVLTAVTVGFSVYFAAVTPSGVGIYWTLANIFSIGVIYLLEVLYSPKKLAAGALEHIRQTRKTPQQQRTEKEKIQALKQREKQDAAKFREAKKELVFYALTGGQYKYYNATIEYLLKNSDITIHYLTNDPEDAVFKKSSECLIPYYASQQKTISLLLNLDADIMVTTVQDLQVYHMKRSVVRDDIEYIHLPHGPASLHLTAREAAYDHFDTFFCVGQHQANELRRREEMSGNKRKNLVKAGYGLYDDLVKQIREQTAAKQPPGSASSPPAASSPALSSSPGKPKILIAPSWQDDCILDMIRGQTSLFDEILDSLLNQSTHGNNLHITVRPHPQFIQICPERIEELEEKYAAQISSGELRFEKDFSDSSSIYSSDILITDWSGIAFEFSYSTLKPSIFINTPMKVLNPDYEKYNLEVTDITLRDKVGVSVDPDNIDSIYEIVQNMLTGKDAYKDKIQQAVRDYLFYPGRSGEACGKYILSRLRERSASDG